jgi:hypothetical protein
VRDVVGVRDVLCKMLVAALQHIHNICIRNGFLSLNEHDQLLTVTQKHGSTPQISRGMDWLPITFESQTS